MQTAVLDSFVAFAMLHTVILDKGNVLYTLTVNWGMEDICTWINCILTTVRQLRISESRRHELFLFVTCKLSLAFVYFMYYCDPMAVYQGELVIKRVREEEASVIEPEDRKLDETLFLFSLITICSFNNYLKVSHSHYVTEGNCLAFQSGLKSPFQLGHLVTICHSWSITRNEMHWGKK